MSSVATSYPGIYIQELPSNTHSIAASPTSVTVFVGYTHPWKTPAGNFGQALEIFSFNDYERLFGGFYQSAAIDANVSYAVNAFFTNGGTNAFVVGLDPTKYFGSGAIGGTQSAFVFNQNLLAGIGFVSLQPLDVAGTTMTIAINNVAADAKGNLTIADIAITYGTATAEHYAAVSLVATDPKFIVKAINGVSKFVTVQAGASATGGTYPAAFPSSTYSETQSLPSAISQGTAVLTETGVTFTALVSTKSPAADVTVTFQNIVVDSSGNLTTADVEVDQGATKETFVATSLLPGSANYLPKLINATSGGSTLVSVAGAGAYPAVYPNATTVTHAVPVGPAGSQVTFYSSGGGVLVTAIETTDAISLTIAINNVQADSNNNYTIADLNVTYGGQSEVYRKISLLSTSPNFLPTRVNGISALITVSPSGTYPTAFPSKAYSETETILTPAPVGASVFSAADFLGVFQEDSWLDKVPLFNLLVTPGIVNNAVLSEALAFAERKLAFYIMDPPAADVADGSPGADNANWVGDFLANYSGTGDTGGNVAPQSPNGALYFPYLLADNPVTGLPTNAAGATFSLPPSGYVAGIFASTDSSRGVWKAPAGLATTLLDTLGVVPGGVMTDTRQGVLNLIGVNCIRSFPGAGTVVFGARTLISANPAYQQWMYVPVRRMALFIEQTLKTNLTWVIFEPNDTPLWTAVRVSIQAFMLSLFNQGAFAGTTPSDAFQVKCDSTTTTPLDQANGVVNIIVAFAPLRPAEFVVVKIAQLAGQASS